MKASELVWKLNKAIDKYGDLDVKLFGTEPYSDDVIWISSFIGAGNKQTFNVTVGEQYTFFNADKTVTV